MSESDFSLWREALQARFAAVQDAYQQLDAEADAQIVRWRYAAKSVFDLRVDYHLRFNEKVGALLDDEPAHERHYYAYGYDAQKHALREITCSCRIRCLPATTVLCASCAMMISGKRS